MSESNIKEALSAYSPSDASIAEMRESFMGLTVAGIDDREGFKAVHEARMVVKRHRVAVEKTRKELKADALEYGRRVDGEAKRLTSLLQPIEDHLKAEEDRIEEEKLRLKREEEERLQALHAVRMERLHAVGSDLSSIFVEGLTNEQFEAELAAATSAHAKRLREEAEERERRQAEEKAAAEARAEEEARLAAERAKLEREREEAAAARRVEEERLAAERRAQEKAAAEERRMIEAERAKMEEERRRLAAEEAARQREIELERARKEAAEKAEREARERVEREKRQAEGRARREEEERRRQEALRPARDKVLAYAKGVGEVEIPETPWTEAIADLRHQFMADLRALVVEVKP